MVGGSTCGSGGAARATRHCLPRARAGQVLRHRARTRRRGGPGRRRGPLNGPRNAAEAIAPTQLRVNTAATGYPTLLRMLNLNYFSSRAQFTDSAGNPVRMAELIAHDGRAFRDTSRRDAASPPVRDTGNRLLTDAIAFGAAGRYDLLLHPRVPGRSWCMCSSSTGRREGCWRPGASR